MKTSLEKYMNKIKNMDDKEYLFGVLSYSIAPTLLGDKPSSIVTLNKNERNLHLLWEKYKKEFYKKCDLKFYELRKREESITILFYNDNNLSSVIYKDSNMKFLKRFGYNEDLTLEEALTILKCRFEHTCPHEIGIFLGFPLQDVICFMEYPEKECLLCGYWKVYNNLESAKEKFFNFDNAKNDVMNSVLDGSYPSILISSIRKEFVNYSG
ncbi:DUF3793 family protein [Clostridium sp. DJ247]|uniref:DUF3793 family protein n=1 Tax=Clostridium sp. DJ247 TaxID=2726188 RepID=UPI0016236BEE|nr:DUF3793 family protein [Clostridium sp. DJ247]MBC2582185.1 DUF3793 family protein [Clostridium sp. DJ247]